MRSFFSLLAIVLCAVFASATEQIPLETCRMCHEDTAAQFLASAHGRAIAAQSAELLSTACATCHQPGENHVDDPSPENVSRRPSNDACVRCHIDRNSRLNLMAPAHQRHSVGCQSCHNISHAEGDTEVLQAVNQRCVSCHALEAGRFQLPYAHRTGNRAFACTECHSMHATGRQGRLALEGDGAPCVVCHSEKRLPYVYPHPPDSQRACLSCHSPHGSTNPHQLIRQNVSSLCLECHSGISSFHELSTPKYRNCTQCHSAIHGSNRDPYLFGN